MQLTIEQHVLDSMHVEAARYAVETGGILVGTDEHTVTDLIPSGERAHRTVASYALDVDHLQPLLDRACDAGRRFLGVWHVHPQGVSRLSEIDRATARAMLRDPEYRLARVLLPLTTRTSKGFETRFFVAEGDEARIREVDSLTIRASARVVSSKGSGGDMQHIQHGHGQTRVVNDTETLVSKGWMVSVRDLPRNQAIRCEQRGVVLWAVLPPEYPLNPPDIFVEEDGRLAVVPHQELPETRVWSSQRSLVEVIHQASRSVLAEREAWDLFHRHRIHRLLRAASHFLRRTA